MQKDVTICGAGIAGISTAYYLACHFGVRNVLIVDQNAPLSLTSDQSTECYRNWWPGPDNAMVGLMNRSIDIMDDLAVQSGNIFKINRRGYLYLTEDCDRISEIIIESRNITKFGAGPLRIHKTGKDSSHYQPNHQTTFENPIHGADLIVDQELLHKYFPYISPSIVAGLHIRRAGWLSAQQLGMYLYQTAKETGIQFIQDRVEEVKTSFNRVKSVKLSDGTCVDTHVFVNAAGPFIKQVGKFLQVDLPVYCELHHKVTFNDHLNLIGREAPLMIWMDPQSLPWSDEESQELAADKSYNWVLGELPPGIHTRPEGGSEAQSVIMLWEYQTNAIEPEFPIPENPIYPDILIRGLSKMVPGMEGYFNRAPKPVVDGGYYTKTKENRPIIGPLNVDGAYIIGALSGFGIMAACAAGELLAKHIAGSKLPNYAPNFLLKRYEDPEYLKKIENLGSFGQL